jgi:O-acetyl-ADP-ribose deacetylase (regulator of RNase III)
MKVFNMSINVLFNDLRVIPPRFNKYIVDWRIGLKAYEVMQKSLSMPIAKRVLRDLESNNLEITVSWFNDEIDQRSEIGGVKSLDWEIPDKSVLVITYENDNTSIDVVNEAISWMMKDEELQDSLKEEAKNVSKRSDILYVKGDATDLHNSRPCVLVHICNDQGKWGKGFVLAVSRRWPIVRQSYQDWSQGKTSLPFILGAVQFIAVEDNLWIANLIGQHGVARRGSQPPINYDAIRIGLRRVGDFAKEHVASVHMPRIGTGLAGGKWSEIYPIIMEELVMKDIPVIVYDYN